MWFAFYIARGVFVYEQVSVVTSGFSLLFELCWKVMKDYLKNELGVSAASTGSPREILGLAFQYFIIEESDTWIKMLRDRNDDSHKYLFTQAVLYKSRIESEYLPEVSKLIDLLSARYVEEEYKVEEIPVDLLNLAKAQNKPLAQLVSEKAVEYHCKEADVFKLWKLNSENKDLDSF